MYDRSGTTDLGLDWPLSIRGAPELIVRGMALEGHSMALDGYIA